MSETSARELLAQADRERAVANEADALRTSFRLGRPVAVKRGLFGRKRYGEEQFTPLSSAASEALYRAARIVEQEAILRAADLESRVTTEGAGA